MSDVPVSGFPDPIGSSPSEARREANSAAGEGAAVVGRVAGRAVAATASVRDSAADVLNSTAEGIKSLGATVEKFSSGGGKKFADTLEKAVGLLERASAAADGLGGVVGSLGGSILPYAAEVKGQAQQAHDNTLPQGKQKGAPQGAGLGSSAQAATAVGNGGHKGTGVSGGSGTYNINAKVVNVNGGGGAGGGANRAKGSGEDEESGGGASFGKRALGYTALLGAGMGLRAAGAQYNEITGNMRTQQTAFSRGGLTTVAGQQSAVRSYLDSGVSYFGQEDLTGAMNIGARGLGGTSFDISNLANLQRASLDMSATQAAQVSAGAKDPGFRNRLYQYGGISTKGMSTQDQLLTAARFAVGKRGGEALTEADYNRMSTIGEMGQQNLSFLTGGNEQLMNSIRDLVGQQVGITGRESANPILASEVDRDTAQARMANELLPEVVNMAKARNATLEAMYSVTADLPAPLQQLVAIVGGISGLLQGLIGGVGLAGVGSSPVAKVATAAGGAAVIRAAASKVAALGSRAGVRAAASKVAALGSRVVGVVAVGAGTVGAVNDVRTGRRKTMEEAAVEAGILSPLLERGWGEELGFQATATIRRVGDAIDFGLLDNTSFGGTDVTYAELRDMTDAATGGDVGDPPPGSAIRTSKPASHVTGMTGRLRSALERMFRANPKLRLNSGYRSVAHQQRLWTDALQKYGSASAARKWVAPPGGSKHNSGLAADIGPPSERAWLKRNADKFGLYLPMTHEPWHVEVKGSRSGKEQTDVNIASAGIAAKGDSAGDMDTRNYAKGANLSPGGVSMSEGSLIASLLGGGGLFGGGRDPAPSAIPGQDSASGDTSSGGSHYGALAGRYGKSLFSGSLAERAAAVAQYAKRAGFSGQALTTAVAIALGESGGDPMATGDVSLQTAKWGPSLGLFQNRTLKNPGAWSGLDGRRDASKMYDPQYNADFAYDLYRSKGGFGDWSVYTSGKFTDYLDEARAGVSQSVGDPATPGSGIDGAPSGGSVSMRGGDKTIIMNISGQQSPAELARKVRAILNTEDDFQTVGMT